MEGVHFLGHSSQNVGHVSLVRNKDMTGGTQGSEENLSGFSLLTMKIGLGEKKVEPYCNNSGYNVEMLIAVE